MSESRVNEIIARIERESKLFDRSYFTPDLERPKVVRPFRLRITYDRATLGGKTDYYPIGVIARSLGISASAYTPGNRSYSRSVLIVPE